MSTRPTTENTDQCPVCDHATARELVVHIGAGVVTRCSLCAAESYSPLPAAAEFERAYNNFDAGVLARQNFDAYVSSARRLLERVLSTFSTSYPNTFLDYGCGGGHFVMAAKAIGLQATGMEYDPASVRAAQQIGLDVRRGRLPGEGQALGSATFDAVLCFHVLEHVPYPGQTIRELVSRTNAGGSLLIGLPNQHSFPAIVKKGIRRLGIKRNEWGYVQPPIHLHGFLPTTMEVLANTFSLRLSRLEMVSPLDVENFPSAPGYWLGLGRQKAVYRAAKALRSPGYMFAVLRKI